MLSKVRVFAPVVALLLGSAHAQSGAFANQVAVNASLKQTVTSRDAKVGMNLAAVTEKPVTIDGTVIPKGSILQGHVVEVAKHNKTTPNGSLTIVFDHLKPKNGDALPIQASVYRIALSESQALAKKRDVDMGMRGSAAEQNTTSAVRQGTDHEDHVVQGLQSDANAPIQVVSAVPGVALSAVVSDQKSGIMTAQNADVELGASMEMVIGVALLKQ